MKLLFPGLTALLILAVGPARAQVSVDDFLPPVQGGPTKVKETEKVRIDKGVVNAATAQDALNAAAEENRKVLKEQPELAAEVRMARFPSGFGFVATGMSVYRTMENPTATRLSQRKAYVIAFNQAKKNLAISLQGISDEGKESIREALKNVNLPKEEMTNLSVQGGESLKQAVDMLLRGFVIYEVKDDPARRTVTATIVTTPKTRGKLSRSGPAALEADNVREGLNQIIQEVKSGVVPPVGGRIILMRSTGETAFVGFGSAVVGSSENSALQARLNLIAQKTAQMRSMDALCGLIVGDRSTWEGEVVEKQREAIKEFEELKANDPLAKDNPAQVRRLEKARQTFVNELRTKDILESARKGALPPGVQTRTWFSPDNVWSFGMSVWSPSLGKAASQAAEEMREGLLIPKQGGEPNKTTSGFTDEKDPKTPRPDPKVKPGPTGKVGKDGDK